MQTLNCKLACLLSAVVLLLAASDAAAQAGDPNRPGVVRLDSIGHGEVQLAGGTCSPGPACGSRPCPSTRGRCCPCPTTGKPHGCCSNAAGRGCESGCPPKKRGCCLGCFGRGDDCPEYGACDDRSACYCGVCRLLGWRGHGDGPYDAAAYYPYGSAAEMRMAHLRCRFGYFIPTGDCGQGLPWSGHYGVVYPLNPDFFDPRDGRIYAAQGYGTPIGVPLAPNVDFTYNYGWGIPSSRLTHVSRHVPGTNPITWPIPPGQRY